MNTHDSNGKLNTSSEHEVKETSFTLKHCKSVISDKSLEIHERIDNALAALAMGEDPNSPVIAQIYREANQARSKELNRQSAMMEYNHAQQKNAHLAAQANKAREQLCNARNKLREQLGEVEADKYILYVSKFNNQNSNE